MIQVCIDSNVRYDSLDKLLYHIPRVVTVNKFDEEAANKFASDMAIARNTGQPIIPIVVDSYGGQVYALLSMLDTMSQHSDIPIATIARGKSMSCGAILFSQGTEGYRFMAPNATLMIHDVASGGHGKTEEIKADAKETERLNDLIYTLMAKGTGHTDPRYFWQIVQDKGRADWFLTAKEAKQHNLANHIRVPSFQLSLKYDLKFT
jgi:ATP-dependent Clp protease protease subunit